MKISSIANYKLNFRQQNSSQQPKISYPPYKIEHLSIDNSVAENLKAEREKLKEKLNNITDFTSSDFNSYLDEYDSFQAKLAHTVACLNVKVQKREKEKEGFEIYAKQMANLPQGQGFSRISGYEDIKQELRQQAIFKDVKEMESEKMPNAYLFYGPAGCGKTTFAKALAEQTLSYFEQIYPEAKSEEEVFEEILKVAQKARENYEKSPDKKRTIISIDEVDTIAYTDSPIAEKLSELLKTCANKYHCTMFFTTNYPQDIDKRILSKNSITHKVPVPAADEKTAEKIIEGYFKRLNKPQIRKDNILKQLFNKEERYSNKDIIDILNYPFLIKNLPEEADFLEAIERGKVVPHLSQDLLRRFEDDKNYLQSNFL